MFPPLRLICRGRTIRIMRLASRSSDVPAMAVQTLHRSQPPEQMLRPSRIPVWRAIPGIVIGYEHSTVQVIPGIQILRKPKRTRIKGISLRTIPKGVRSDALCFSKQTRRRTHLCIHSLDQLFTFVIGRVNFATNWMTLHLLARIRF